MKVTYTTARGKYTIFVPNEDDTLYLTKKRIKHITFMNTENSVLRSLHLYDNAITDMRDSNLPPLLEKINLCDNSIVNMKDQKWPKYLQELLLNGNLISDLTDYIWPTNLIILNLSFNNIKNIDLQNWPEHLRTLDLSNNKMKKIKNQTWPDNLGYLYLRYNELTKFENMPVDYCKIFLGHNSVTEIKQHIPVTMSVTGISILQHYKKSEVSAFTQKYPIYNLLTNSKIQYMHDTILSYLTL